MSLKPRTSIRRQFLHPIPQFEKVLSSPLPLVHVSTPDDVTEQITMPLPKLAIEPEQETITISGHPLTFPLGPPLSMPRTPVLQTPMPIALMGKPKLRKKSKKRLPLWFAACSIVVIIVLVFLSQGNGVAGAWMADTMRAVLGPTVTAQIESWYLSLSNTSSQLQYQLSNKPVDAPWKTSSVTPTPSPTPPAKATILPMALSAMSPIISPALPGEGTWNTLDNAPVPYNYLPLDARAFLRPDPTHPYAIVTMLQFDERFTLLHVVGGTIEPGGPRGVHGPGVISANDEKGNTLLAAFNGGFKYADGQYGLMTNGVVYVPALSGSATIAITKEGKIILGAWGNNPQLNSQNTDLLAWRQNGALLIDNGVINPLTQDGAAWGGTILNSAYTWRSALGVTAQGTLIYAAGNALTAATLGQAMKAAGVVTAMQTDINPFWVRAFLYDRDQNAPLRIVKLNPQMQGSGYEYLNGTQRDFFYLTRFAPAKLPSNGRNQQMHQFT